MKAGDNNLLLGDILKTFGPGGELIVKFSNQAPTKINIEEPIFVIIDGLSVPFYFKIFDERANNKALVVFENMETEKLAESLVGKQMWLPNKKKIAKKEFDLNSLVGFVAFDTIAGELGAISDFLNFPNNPCFRIMHQNKEIIVPINNDLIVKVDAKGKTIDFNLPEGLLDFYLNQ